VHVVFLHQQPLKEAIIKRYLNEGGFTNLHKAELPFNPVEEKSMTDDDMKEGKMAASSPRHIGGLLYVTRGTAPGLAYAVRKMARRTKRWRAYDDRSLHCIMAYMNGKLKQGLELSMPVKWDADVQNTTDLQGFSDADWGGDLETSKSTSGWATGYDNFDGLTHCYLDWGSKMQTAVALSTGEAEYTACTYSSSKSAMPMQIFLEEVLGRRVMLRLWVDNSAAYYTAATGETKRMRHMSKTQRIEANFVNGLIRERAEDRSVAYVPTDQNVADVGTKVLGKLPYEKALVRMNIKDFEQFEDTHKRALYQTEYKALTAAKESGIAAAATRTLPTEDE